MCPWFQWCVPDVLRKPPLCYSPIVATLLLKQGAQQHAWCVPVLVLFTCYYRKRDYIYEKWLLCYEHSFGYDSQINWKNTEKISMAPAQGWHAKIENYSIKPFFFCIFMKYSIVVCTTIHYIVLLLPTLLAPFLPIFFVVAFASWNLLPVDSLCILTSFFHHCCSRIVLLFAESNHLLLLLLVQRRLAICSYHKH